MWDMESRTFHGEAVAEVKPYPRKGQAIRKEMKSRVQPETRLRAGQETKP